MKTKKLVNENSNSELTVEILKSKKGFENFTEQQAQIFISKIKRLANLFYNFYSNNAIEKSNQ